MTEFEKQFLHELKENNKLLIKTMSAISDLSAAVAQLGTNVTTLNSTVQTVLTDGIGSGTPEAAITPITAQVAAANAQLASIQSSLAAALPAAPAA